MSSDRYRILIYFVLVFALTVNIVLAGTTGKIAGRVVDKETNEPLIGIILGQHRPHPGSVKFFLQVWHY